MLPHSLKPTRFVQNYLATMLFLVSGWFVCFHLSGFHRETLTSVLRLPKLGLPQGLSVDLIFRLLLIVYAIALIPFYRKYPWLHAKALVFARGLWLSLWRVRRWARRSHEGTFDAKPMLSTETRQAGLALLMKFFFAPLMLNWCVAHLADITRHFGRLLIGLEHGLSGRLLFDHALFAAAFQAILFIDTMLFTLGYLVETPRLKNRIVSVEPTFLGWAVCLACYPPFNDWTGWLLKWQSTDFPRFGDDTVHVLVNCAILCLMGIYSWASVALGFRASNLTNRGIVARGPYRVVRHPAYVTKNLAWWIGALPAFGVAFDRGLTDGLTAVFFMAGWSFLYFLRAVTEERHLRMANNGYAEYAKKVRWRFIPGLV